jgi:hypothetical protein
LDLGGAGLVLVLVVGHAFRIAYVVVFEPVGGRRLRLLGAEDRASGSRGS